MHRFNGQFTWYDLSARFIGRWRWSANLVCSLTADERPIHGNENQSDSLQQIF